MKGARLAFMLVVGGLSVAAASAIGCGARRPVVVYPSCGEERQRASDGAFCRECVDADGSTFARCHAGRGR